MTKAVHHLVEYADLADMARSLEARIRVNRSALQALVPSMPAPAVEVADAIGADLDDLALYARELAAKIASIKTASAETVYSLARELVELTLAKKAGEAWLTRAADLLAMLQQLTAGARQLAPDTPAVDELWRSYMKKRGVRFHG